MLRLSRVLVLEIVSMQIPRTLSIFQIIFCVFNESKALPSYFFFRISLGL